jgi:two-component system, NtrC family, response regulator AtoC
VVDDDRLSANLLRANLERPGRVQVSITGDGDGALRLLALGGIDAVLTDLEMPGMDGVELVKRIRATAPTFPVLVLSGQASLTRAVEAMRAGATDFLQKPVNVQALMALVERALKERPLREELRKAADRVRWLVGSHRALEEVRAFTEQVAAAPYARVLITGESGTGKSLLARAIHDLTRAPGLFTTVNCAALPAALLEAELFGHEKGAFTDARELKRGLAEAADRGTLFLDELDALPLELQAKLLVFLETREVRRVGGVHGIPVRTRVIGATGADLHRLAADGRFRRDLLYRLDVASVTMPPLRAMPEVIPELAQSFVQELCADLGRAVPEISGATLSALSACPWPGNARELRNALERALIFHRCGPLLVPCPESAAPPTPDTGGLAVPLGLTLQEVELRYIQATLESRPGVQGEIAVDLGISRKTLWEKRRRYGL